MQTQQKPYEHIIRKLPSLIVNGDTKTNFVEYRATITKLCKLQRSRPEFFMKKLSEIQYCIEQLKVALELCGLSDKEYLETLQGIVRVYDLERKQFPDIVESQRERVRLMKELRVQLQLRTFFEL